MLFYMEDINKFFIKKLDTDLLYNKIYPYTYQPKPKSLNLDVRNYKILIDEILNYYGNAPEMDFQQGYADIIDFIKYKEHHINQNHPLTFNKPKIYFFKVFRRMYGKKNLTEEEARIIFRNFTISPFCDRGNTNPVASRSVRDFIFHPGFVKKIKQIFALLSIEDRKWFIDHYVIFDAFYNHENVVGAYLIGQHINRNAQGGVANDNFNRQYPTLRCIPSYLQQNPGPDPFLGTGINKKPQCVVEGMDTSWCLD